MRVVFTSLYRYEELGAAAKVADAMMHHRNLILDNSKEARLVKDTFKLLFKIELQKDDEHPNLNFQKFHYSGKTSMLQRVWDAAVKEAYNNQ
jgi:hypothetical protein